MAQLRSVVRRAGAALLLVLVVGQQPAHAADALRDDIRAAVHDFRAFDHDIGLLGTDITRITDLTRHAGVTVRRDLTELSTRLTANVPTEPDPTFRAAYKDLSTKSATVAEAIGRLSTALPDLAAANIPPGQLATIQQARSAYGAVAIQLEVAIDGYERQLEKLSLTTISLDGYHLGYVYFYAAIAGAVLFVSMLVWSLSTAARGMTKFWFARLGLTVVALWAFVGAAGTYCWFWWAQRKGGDLQLVWLPLAAGSVRLVVGLMQYRTQANDLHDDLYVTARASEVTKVGAAALHLNGPVPASLLHDHPPVGLLSDHRATAVPVAPVAAAPWPTGPSLPAPPATSTPMPPPPPRRSAVRP